MSESGAGERTEEATPRRKQEARKKGTVAKSHDLSGGLVLLAIAMVLPSAVSSFGSGMIGGIHAAGRLTSTVPSTDRISSIAANVLAPILPGMAMLVFVAMGAGVFANFAQVGILLSGEALKPDFKKVNPLEGLKRILSRRALFEGAKAGAKSLAFGFIPYRAITNHWDVLVGLGSASIGEASAVVGGLIHTIITQIAMLWVVFGVIDYIFQRKQVDKQLKMTKDELKREMKEQEGSPEVKMEMMRLRKKLTKGRMMQQVPKADVIITNPTHFAVAIVYERSGMHAPMVVAKGMDNIALKIREVAKENKVPIVENPPLARALYKQCEVGDFVPRDLFVATAEVLAYVYRTLKGVAA